MNPQQKPDGYVDAVSMALVEGGRVLLVKRGKNPSKGMYAFPGGRVEQGESFEQAVHRELMEETGLRASGAEILERLQFSPSRPGWSGYVLHVFTGRLEGGDLQAGDDAAEAGWFTPDEIAVMPLTESAARIARRLLERHGTATRPADG